MNLKTLFLSLLFCSLFVIACDSDDEAPLLTVEDVSNNISNTYVTGDSLYLKIDASDDKEIEKIQIDMNTADFTKSQSIAVSATEYQNTIVLAIEGDQSGDGSIGVTATDRSGNSTTQTIDFVYDAITVGQLDLNMYLTYNESPLLTFKDYAYPDGRTINFTRISTYIADISVDQEVLSEISYHDFTSLNSTEEGAANGLSILTKSVKAGSYDALSFGIGVPNTLNASDPGAYPSGHPLARPAEHWFSWGSFIFMKIEGNLDSNGDGVKDLPIALHLGADEAYRVISLARDIQLEENGYTSLSFELDIYKLLEGDQSPYDIDENPQIHSLTQVDAVIELADNLDRATR